MRGNQTTAKKTDKYSEYEIASFAELSDDDLIICLKGKYWELIVEDLQIIAKSYIAG